MLDTFKARLKAKTKAAGVNLSQKRIDAFADRLHKKNPEAKEDAEHDTLIDELDELVSFADVAKEDDRVRTLEARAKQPAKTKNQESDDDDTEDEDEQEKGAKPKDRTPKWAKDLIAEVQNLKAEKKVTSIKTQLAEKLKGKEIPEKFYHKRALPEKEEDLDAFVSEIENDWTELKQETNNALLGGNGKPAGGTGGSTKDADVDKAIDAWASEGKKDDAKN